jgi:MoxR-like ATPase
MRFSRIQFTPDLLPGDITGANIYNQAENRFVFTRGPIFGNLILADEINRASPKTQSALLEAMQEQQVTVEGTGHPLEAPFLVIATQNPIEFEGTYPLPEAQLDRFIMKIAVGYPDEEAELQILMQRRDRRRDEVPIEAVVSTQDFLQMQDALESVYMDERIARYVVALVRATRSDTRVAVGASPRGMLSLFKLARASALLEERDYVTPEDVKAVAVQALSHRVILKPEIWVRQIREEEVVRDLLQRVPAPAPVEE